MLEDKIIKKISIKKIAKTKRIATKKGPKHIGEKLKKDDIVKKL
jgi:hypothetical protein